MLSKFEKFSKCEKELVKTYISHLLKCDRAFIMIGDFKCNSMAVLFREKQT